MSSALWPRFPTPRATTPTERVSRRAPENTFWSIFRGHDDRGAPSGVSVLRYHRFGHGAGMTSGNSSQGPGAEAAPVLSESAPLVPGQVLAGKYRIEQVLGSGGMGVVVAARHLQMKHRVALKLLQPEGPIAPEAVARLLREAQHATAIQSEHVVRVTDLGALPNGRPYLVMEYLEGSDLGQLLQRHGPLPERVAVDYLLQTLAGVAEAHALGIVQQLIGKVGWLPSSKALAGPLDRPAPSASSPRRCTRSSRLPRRSSPTSARSTAEVTWAQPSVSFRRARFDPFVPLTSRSRGPTNSVRTAPCCS